MCSRTFPRSPPSKAKQVAWGWYEEGYDREPNDKGDQLHTGYIGHHNGPQYFGYVVEQSGR